MLTIIVLTALFFGQSHAQYKYVSECPCDEFVPSIDRKLTASYEGTSDTRYLCGLFGPVGFCDEQAIIDLLTLRNNTERMQIQFLFPAECGGDLKDELDRCMSGATKNTVFGMLTEEFEYIANEVHTAMKYFNEASLLVSTLNVLTDDEMTILKQTYENIYGESLMLAIDTYLSGNLKDVMKEELIPRSTDPADDKQADKDVNTLINAGSGLPGTGSACDDYISVFMRRSFAHLCLVFEKFYAQTGADIKDQIQVQFDRDNVALSFTAIADCVRDPAWHFAGAFMDIWGLNDNDSVQQVLTITRSERDMENIKIRYQERYGVSLVDDIKSNNSGNYEYVLLGLVGH